MTMPPDDRPRASRTIKLVLMGIAGAALLYSCTPGIGAGMGFWPWLWFWGNPFARGPMVTTPSATTSTTQSQPSQRGGFGSSAGEHGSTAS
ncbi:MAG TPA: hypothetical protein VKY24_27255 [Reyranella sp.]|jgi:hypothetical protein|nr:hypothetical protein [Reyranella sp.]